MKLEAHRCDSVDEKSDHPGREDSAGVIHHAPSDFPTGLNTLPAGLGRFDADDFRGLMVFVHSGEMHF